MTMMFLFLLCAAGIGFFVWRQRRPQIPDGPAGVIASYRPSAPPENATPIERLTILLRNHAHALVSMEDFRAQALALWDIAGEAERPLLVAVMGEFKTGKSTFLNTLVGAPILQTDAAPATAVVTLLRYGEEKTVTLHKKDGTTAPYAFEQRKEITAEGDASLQALRDALAYVEITYPAPLLQHVNLIDTPGLNVHRQAHIDASEAFQDKADLVLWVFSATRAASRTELASIRALGARLRPIAIVNQLDAVDEEEMTKEDVIASLTKRLGASVTEVLGLSAAEAQAALASKDEAALAKSGWTAFRARFDAEVVKCAETRKRIAMMEKVTAFTKSFQTSVETLEATLRQETTAFSNQETARKTLEERKSLLDQLVEKYSTVDDGAKESSEIYDVLKEDGAASLENDDFLEIVMCVHYFIESFKETVEPLRQLGGYEPYLRDLEFYLSECQSDEAELNCLLEECEARGNRMDAFKERGTELNNDIEAYNHSGFFGGAPTFDFSGKRARLENRVQAMDREADRLNAEREEIADHLIRIIGSATDKNHEFADRFRSLSADLQRQQQEAGEKLRHMAENYENDKKRHEDRARALAAARSIASELTRELDKFRIAANTQAGTDEP